MDSTNISQFLAISAQNLTIPQKIFHMMKYHLLASLKVT